MKKERRGSRFRTKKKSKVATKRIATGAIRSIDKTRSWIKKKGEENILCDGGCSSKIREKMVVKKKEDEKMELLSVWPSYTAVGEIFFIDRQI